MKGRIAQRLLRLLRILQFQLVRLACDLKVMDRRARQAAICWIALFVGACFRAEAWQDYHGIMVPISFLGQTRGATADSASF